LWRQKEGPVPVEPGLDAAHVPQSQPAAKDPEMNEEQAPNDREWNAND
jgi:hypothetical protein